MSPSLKYVMFIRCNPEDKMASNRSKFGLKADVPEDEREYVTPSNYELEKLLSRSTVAYTHVNEVWPNIFIGDE